MSREVIALHGDRPPPVAIVDANKAYRKTFKRDFKPSHWENVEFENSARADGLRLKHWRKQPTTEKTTIEQDGEAMDVDTDAATAPYAFAKYNIEVTVPTYTDEQYNKFLSNNNWSREETDYLMHLVKDYYQKWPVIIDRYEWTPIKEDNEGQTEGISQAVAKPEDQKRRDLEALKERYYFISAKMMEQSFVHGVADMNAEEFALHEQYTRFRPEVERQRKHLAWELSRRKAEEVKEEEYLLSELQRIMISAQKFETERAELRQRLEHAVSPNKDQRAIEMSSASLHQLWQQLVQLDRSRKPRARISVDGSLQSPAGGLQTPASAGGHRDSLGGSNQKKGSISQAIPVRNLSARDEIRFGVSSPPERIVSGVSFRTDKLLKLRQAKSQIQTQKIGQALAHLDIPELLALPTTKVVQAFETLIQKINLLLDARKMLAKEETELSTSKAVKAEVDKERRQAEGITEDAADASADAEGEEADADDEPDADGEDVDMADAPAAAAEEAPRPTSSHHTRNKRSVSVLSATSSRGSRRKK
jgi:DNA methyltransferase 1-associated protein 1